MEKQMSAKNKKFWAATKGEKRVMIAKDIIKQIKAGHIRPKTGAYIKLSKNKFVKTDGPLDQYFDKTPCNACALGSCFISLVTVGDKLKISDVANTDYDGDYFMTRIENDSPWRDNLREIFPSLQLSMIESAFEVSHMRDERDGDIGEIYQDDNRRTIKKSIMFGRKYVKSSDRLIAICRNIIKNEGKFKP